jgi:hypothetical protein
MKKSANKTNANKEYIKDLANNIADDINKFILINALSDFLLSKFTPEQSYTNRYFPRKQVNKQAQGEVTVAHADDEHECSEQCARGDPELGREGVRGTGEVVQQE